ncbi:lactate utilization protein [Candidatus Curtissbacteria bacterium]|nr:lactate utilization protein [Candidatus Curtissbacteria bacterium]
MSKWDQLADDSTIEKTIKALKANGIEAEVVENGEAAKKRVLELIPEKSEVMTMTSMTLEEIGIAKEIDESGRYDAIRPKLLKMDYKTQGREMRKLANVPDWTIGSVHAVTEDGHLLIASNSGSQLPAYAYSAGQVVWVVGAQKIVKNTDDGIKRIYEHSFPLEDERAQKAYGMRSGVNKILIVNKEIQSGRIHVIFVKEKLGF